MCVYMGNMIVSRFYIDIGRTHFSIPTVRTLQRIMWEADVTEFQHNQKRVDVVTVCSCPLLYPISSSPQTKPFKQQPPPCGNVLFARGAELPLRLE